MSGCYYYIGVQHISALQGELSRLSSVYGGSQNLKNPGLEVDLVPEGESSALGSPSLSGHDSVTLQPSGCSGIAEIAVGKFSHHLVSFLCLFSRTR